MHNIYIQYENILHSLSISMTLLFQDYINDLLAQGKCAEESLRTFLFYYLCLLSVDGIRLPNEYVINNNWNRL